MAEHPNSTKPAACVLRLTTAHVCIGRVKSGGHQAPNQQPTNTTGCHAAADPWQSAQLPASRQQTAALMNQSIIRLVKSALPCVPSGKGRQGLEKTLLPARRCARRQAGLPLGVITQLLVAAAAASKGRTGHTSCRVCKPRSDNNRPAPCVNTTRQLSAVADTPHSFKSPCNAQTPTTPDRGAPR
jgi:hypothetical protein